MTRRRFLWCLKLLRLPRSHLSRMVGSSEVLVRKWASGERNVPDAVGEWLEACVKIRLNHPYPPPPQEWRTNLTRQGLRLPTLQMGNKRIW